MYHAYNVIKYLTGDYYNISTIYDDIKQTFEDINSGKHNIALDKFHFALNQYLNYRYTECINFAKILMLDGYPNEYLQIMQYYNLPFKNSRDPKAEKLLFSSLMNYPDIGLDYVIMGLLGYYEYEKFNGNQEFLNRMYFFFHFQPLSFEDLNKSQRVGWIDKMPSDQNQIIQEYNQVLANPADPKFAKKVGNYGELMFYKYLKDNIHDKAQLIWVSKDIGDGFGYDIAVYDSLYNKLYLYEVKTTTKDEYFVETSLNEYESRICNLMRDHDDTEYHIIKILLGNEVRMIDINDKDETVSNLYQQEENYKVLKKSDNFLNSYMAIEN